MLSVHRSERADRLVDALGDLLADPLPDPITPEIVAVPTRGVERWLTQRLSHRLGATAPQQGGVCANLLFPFPGTLVGLATAAATTIATEDDPWRPERCVWPLLAVIDRSADDPQLGPLAAHLRAATPPDRHGRPGPLRRFATARRLADLFDHYAVHRPELITSWADGHLLGGRAVACDDGTEAWQAHLWRLLRDELGVVSPAERIREAARRLGDEPQLLDLPPRVSLFGLTRLPASHLEVLQAVAARRDVHLFLLHPSGQLWTAVAAAAPAPPPGLRRAEDPTARLAHNPLLRSWGRDAREMQLVLGGRGITSSDHRPVDDTPLPPGAAGASLLRRLQHDIRADRRPPGAPSPDQSDHRPILDPSDRSVQVHACHGRSRQVEVMRDALLHLLAGDHTLELRDIIVMCPDIEAFAPLVHAAFGADDPEGGDEPDAGHEGGGRAGGSGMPRLRVRLADRSLRQTNPLLAVAAQLLALAGSRVTASEVLDLASRPPVARRFRFDQDELSILERWVADTGIRWGLDAAHRHPWALDRVAANTWAAGFDRLLLGATMAGDDCRLFGDTVPYDDVPSSAVDLAGRAAELLSRLTSVLDSLQGQQPLDAWIEALISGTELLAVAGAGDEWQLDQLRRVLGEVVGEATMATAGDRQAAPARGSTRAALPAATPGPADGQSRVLSLDEIRAVLDSRLRGRPTRANFRTGDLTICTLVPMRSVPHRVVALLGLDDGAFPRHPGTDGDDLLLADERVGDRDARSEDRQLLLDALLAATEHLIVTYGGRDERTNRPRPPAVPIAELLDAVDDTVVGADGAPARRRILVNHPLQPFDARNFEADALTGAGPWSFDHVHLAGSRAALAQCPPPPWLSGPLPAPDEPVLQLDDLVRFVEHPVRAFLRRRLGLYLSDRSDRLSDDLPIELDALERWGVGDRLLQACLASSELHHAEIAERSRGFLPPGRLADDVLDGIRPEVDKLATAVRGLGFDAGPADSLDVHLELAGGRTLIGTVANLRRDTIVQCSYSRLAAKHRLAAWVRFLAAGAARPEMAISSSTIGRGQGRQPPQRSFLPPLAGAASERRERALQSLSALVDLYDRGMRSPLPLSCDTSAAWADARYRGDSDDDAYRKAALVWEGQRFAGEAADVEHVSVWGERRRLRDLFSEPPDPGETGPTWAEGDTSRFAVLARRLWWPLLDHEQLGPLR